MQKLLVEMQYLGPVSYYRKLAEFRNIIIETHENFEKSTYRNRCYIAGPNGKLRLSVPIERGKHQHTKYREVKISYDEDWQKIHWQSLCSAYRRSAYFEFYEDHFESFYQHKWDYLFEFNLKLFDLVIELLDLDLEVTFSEQYQKNVSQDVLDFRSEIRPNITMDGLPRYHQVFEDRMPFLPDLSIVDLLFNTGPSGKALLTGNMES